MRPLDERLKQIIREVYEEHQAEFEELVFCQYDRRAPLSMVKQYIEQQKHV